MSTSDRLYSVDASALIEMKEVYRKTVFPSMWQFVGSLGEAGRLRVAQPVRDECLDGVFRAWFEAHSGMIAPWSDELNAFVSALQAELDRIRRPLTDPESTENRGDPFVVALALMLDGRDCRNLSTRSGGRCTVVCYEGRRPRARLAKIADVCDYYGLGYTQWPDMLEGEGWSS